MLKSAKVTKHSTDETCDSLQQEMFLQSGSNCRVLLQPPVLLARYSALIPLTNLEHAVINKTLAFADAIALIATLIYFLPKSTRRDPRNLTTAGVDESVNGKQLFPKQDAMPERELTNSRNGTNCNIFDVWNADTDIANTTNFLDGSSICADAFALSFEAVTDSCVRSVRFRLIGSEGTDYSNIERVPKYLLFQNQGDLVNGRRSAPLV
jgi:hypothetical protein